MFLLKRDRPYTVYPGIRHFKFCGRVFAQSRMFYENRTASLDPSESWLACCIWINGYDYHNKEDLLTVLPARSDSDLMFCLQS